MNLLELLQSATTLAETQERQISVLKKRVEALEAELAYLKEEYEILPSGFSVEEWKAGHVGLACRGVCQKPAFGTSCGSCDSCQRAIRIAKKKFP